MLSVDDNENSQKQSVDLISKITTLHMQHTFFCTFLCRCFARLPRGTSRNFLVIRFMCSCSLFLAATHFHLGGR